MPLVGLYAQERYGFGAENGGVGSWTVDFEIPASTVSAVSNLSYYYFMDAWYGYAFSGVQSYATEDPNTHIPLPPHLVGFGVPITGVVPHIFDFNVITVTFGYGVAALNGNSGVYADGVFLVWVWG